MARAAVGRRRRRRKRRRSVGSPAAAASGVWSDGGRHGAWVGAVAAHAVVGGGGGVGLDRCRDGPTDGLSTAAKRKARNRMGIIHFCQWPHHGRDARVRRQRTTTGHWPEKKRKLLDRTGGSTASIACRRRRRGLVYFKKFSKFPVISNLAVHV